MTLRLVGFSTFASAFLLATLVAGKACAAVTLQSAWSANPVSSVAIDETIASLKQKKVATPKLIVTYFTEQYDPQQVEQKIHLAFPKTRVFGQTVYMGVFNDEGLHVSKSGSIAALSFDGPELSVGIAGAEIEPSTNVQTLAATLAKDAKTQAEVGNPTDELVVLMAAKKGNEEAFIAGINDVFTSGPMLVGGTPSTNSFGGGAVIANDKIYRHGAALATIYSSRKEGASFYSGFVASAKSGTVTDAKGRVLKTIDNQPAQQVYKKWADGKFDHLKSDKEDIATMETAVAPLAKRVTTKEGQERYVTIRPQKFMADGSLTLGADVKTGDRLYFVEGTKEQLTKHAGVVTDKAITAGGIPIADLAGGLQIYCAGASTVIGLHEGGAAPLMVDEIKKEMHGHPFIGGFTSAEQGQIAGSGYFNSNLMSSMAIFSK